MLIALSNGGWMQVDEIDYLDLVDQGSWFCDDDGYARRTIAPKQRKPGQGTCIKVHKYIGQQMGITGQVDHRNGDRLDNRRENLRTATTQENTMNQGIRSTNNSGYKGVSFNKKTYKWVANIMICRQNYYLGTFDTKEEANEAYVKESIKRQGLWRRR